MAGKKTTKKKAAKKTTKKAPRSAPKQDDKSKKAREYHAKLRKMPPAKRELYKLNALFEKLEAHLDDLKTWTKHDEVDQLVVEMDDSVKALGRAMNHLGKLPDDYQAKTRKRGGPKIDVVIGAWVAIKKAKREEYGDVFKQSDMDRLKVIKLHDASSRSAKITVESSDGYRQVMRKSEVYGVGMAAAEASTEEEETEETEEAAG